MTGIHIAAARVGVPPSGGTCDRLKPRLQRGPAQARKRQRMSRSPVGVSRTVTNPANEYRYVIWKLFCRKGLRRCLCPWWTKRRRWKAVSQMAHLGGPHGDPKRPPIPAVRRGSPDPAETADRRSLPLDTGDLRSVVGAGSETRAQQVGGCWKPWKGRPSPWPLPRGEGWARWI